MYIYDFTCHNIPNQGWKHLKFGKYKWFDFIEILEVSEISNKNSRKKIQWDGINQNS